MSEILFIADTHFGDSNIIKYENRPFFYLYGHVHGTKMYQTVSKQSACVSAERWDYKPVNIEEIKRRIIIND